MTPERQLYDALVRFAEDRDITLGFRYSLIIPLACGGTFFVPMAELRDHEPPTATQDAGSAKVLRSIINARIPAETQRSGDMMPPYIDGIQNCACWVTGTFVWVQTCKYHPRPLPAFGKRKAIR